MPSRVKANVKPDILVWARTSAGLSVSEAARRLGVKEERLQSWEVGEDLPSVPQLRDLADVYRRPLAVFYLQVVPRDFMVIRDLRRMPGTGFRQMPSDLQYEIRRATQRRALAIDLVDELEGERPPRFDLEAGLRDDPEEVGARIRGNLKVTAPEQLRWRDADGRAAFNAWRARIESIGVLVFQATRIDSEIASGFAISEAELPVIVVNRKDAPTRRTFSLMHELAHLTLRVSGVSDLETDDRTPPEDQAIEIFCNAVAAATLVPRDLLYSDERVQSRRSSREAWPDPDISDLARSFGVSREALLRRLLTFGLTTEAFYRQKRSQYIAEYQARKQRERENPPEGEMKRNMPQETLSTYGRPLVRMILGTYHQDKITLNDVAGYLGIKTKHLSKLEQLA